MIAMRPITIAGPDTQRHRRRNAGIAGLDFRLAVLVAKILKIELLSDGIPQPCGALDACL